MTPTRAVSVGRAVVRYAVPVVAVLAALLQPVGPAIAAAPVPAPNALPTGIEPLPAYQGAALCSPVVRKGPTLLRTLLTQTYGTTAYGITRSCTGSAGSSEHNEGRALDWMISGKQQRADAKAFLKWLLATDARGNTQAMARRLGIMYIVWNNKMFRLYDTSRGWAEYDGCLSKPSAAYDTTCHRNHVHFSFTWDGAAGRTSYWSGKVVKVPACPRASTAPAAPKLSTKGLEFVPLPTARILDTAHAVGVTAKCRLTQDGWSGENRRIDLQVAGAGGVPATGAVAVVLSLQTLSPNAPSRLYVQPTGSPRRLLASSTSMRQNGLGAVTVPLGSNGRVSLTLSTGATHVVADVMGYYRVVDGTGQLFHPTAPQRVLDTVATQAELAPGETRTLQVAGLAGVPDSGARAVAIEATVYDGTVAGGVTVYGAGDPQPPTTLLNVRATANQRRTNLVVARLDDSGQVVVRNSAQGARHVLLDVVGWWAPATVPDGSLYRLLAGTEVIDSTQGKGLAQGLTSGVPATAALTSVGGVPGTGVTAVGLQATVLSPSARTAFVAWPGGPSPDTRTASPVKGVDQTVFAVAPLSADGRVSVESTEGNAGLRAYAVGYWYRP